MYIFNAYIGRFIGRFITLGVLDKRFTAQGLYSFKNFDHRDLGSIKEYLNLKYSSLSMLHEQRYDDVMLKSVKLLNDLPKQCTPDDLSKVLDKMLVLKKEQDTHRKNEVAYRALVKYSEFAAGSMRHFVGIHDWLSNRETLNRHFNRYLVGTNQFSFPRIIDLADVESIVSEVGSPSGAASAIRKYVVSLTEHSHLQSFVVS